jgi:hypothetical protein
MGRLNLYRNISITFIVFAAMILCAVFLAFYSQATIVITPDAQTVNLNFVTDINVSTTTVDVNKQDIVNGKIITTTTAATSVFNVSSTKFAEGGNIVGRIKLVNNYSKPQKLVKTTQLQAANGVIVRTNDEVEIPASGSASVNVYPKDPASFKPIEPGHLTIIKLWPQLQSQIYGEVTDRLAVNTGGEVFYISENDINRAKKEIIDSAVNSYALKSGISAGIIKGELVSYELDRKLGDETKTFTMTATVRLKIYQANETDLAQLIKRKVQKMDLKGLSADSIDLSQVNYNILDVAKDTVTVKVSYPLKAYLTEGNEMLDKNRFTEKTAAEIRAWAAQTSVIKNIEVIISPYWRDKTPKSPKRIKIIIQ